MSRFFAARPVADITLMTALLLSYIWLWQGSFPGDFFVCLALYFAIGVSSHWRRKETPAEIGIRADNLGRCFLYGIKLVGPLIVVAIAFGAYLGTIELPKPVGPLQLSRSLAWGVAWATMQQYGLACVYYRRLRDLVGSHWGATLGAASIFATLHLPNPFLVPVTFLGGIISCQIYRRAPNLFVLGLLHLLLSVSLRMSFGPDITHRMKVGPGYWRQSVSVHSNASGAMGDQFGVPIATGDCRVSVSSPINAYHRETQRNGTPIDRLRISEKVQRSGAARRAAAAPVAPPRARPY